MTEDLRHPAQQQKDPFDICIMIVEEECCLDAEPAEGDEYERGMHGAGLAIRDRIRCAQRNPDPPAAKGKPDCDELERLRERCEAYKGQVEAGAAEIARLKQGKPDCGAWRPIETAPRDGTIVLICGFSPDYFVSDAKWDGEWMLFDVSTGEYTEPSFKVSHWMPLPAPPSSVTSAYIDDNTEDL